MNENLRQSLDRLHEKQDDQTTKISSLEVSVAKQEAHMETYMKQSDRMAGELAKLNENMAVYNAELKVHIAGVMELKEMNRLMNEGNRQRQVIIDERLRIAEKPIVWASNAGHVLKWAASILGGIAALVTLVLRLMGKI